MLGIITFRAVLFFAVARRVLCSFRYFIRMTYFWHFVYYRYRGTLLSHGSPLLSAAASRVLFESALCHVYGAKELFLAIMASVLH